MSRTKGVHEAPCTLVTIETALGECMETAAVGIVEYITQSSSPPIGEVDMGLVKVGVALVQAVMLGM